ncbi:MAG: hypothetical protein SNH35_08910 [Rikenellaceae bacterium]
MKREIITISENGVVNVPNNVQMSKFEIARLLGVIVPTVRGAIKRLLNGRQIVDCSGGIVRGNRIVPEYFGLEVVIAIAMQVDSYEADLFRKYIILRITRACNVQPIYIALPNNQICN